MRKKKAAAVIAMIVIVAQIAGCGATESTTGESATESVKKSSGSSVFTGEPEQGATIYVLENDTAISKGYFAKLIEAFNETYAEYEITAVDANMDQYLDLANDGPYGYGPDVLYQANDIIMKYAEDKHIYPLPVEEMECYEQIPQSAWDAYQIEKDGVLYTCGVPVNVQAPMLYYRKDLLPKDWESTWDDNANKVPDMIENWNDMYAWSIARHKEDSSKYGYMKSLYDTYFSSGFLFSYGAYVFGNNNTDPSDVGFAFGESEKGAWVLKQLASVMNEECIDDTITSNAYNKLAQGTYFATITTPDVYSTFYDELVAEYEKEGLSNEEAKKKADESLVMTTLPMLPKSGDLSEENPNLIESKTMGGINGYAVSAYTEYPNACLAFVEFATSYDMVVSRSELLGIAPAREDAAEAAGGISKILYQNLADKNIILMPSIKEVAQIWTPAETFFIDLAKDAFRPVQEEKYTDMESLKQGLDNVDQQIYDAIFTLK